jgi:hypothetical protein
VQPGLGLALDGLRQLVEDVGVLVSIEF